MANLNIYQVYQANPITSNASTDLIYCGQSPYGISNDAAITFANFSAQFSSPWTASGTNSAVGGDGTSVASGSYSLSYGNTTNTVSGNNSYAFGTANNLSGNDLFASGNNHTLSGHHTAAFGNTHSGSGANAFIFGRSNTCNANYGFAGGYGAVVSNDGSVVWGDSNETPNTDTTGNQFNLTFAGGFNFYIGSTLSIEIDTSSNCRVKKIGSGLAVAEGSNAKQGVATLSGGTVTVSNTSVTANSRILLTIQSPGGTVGSVYISGRTASTSFTITSTSALDSSIVAYQLFEPA